MTAIFEVFSAVGDFIGSIVDTFSYLFNFGRSLFTDFADLLSVVPSAFSTVIYTFLIFSIVLACKRAIL